MKKFEVPQMNVMKLTFENVLTESNDCAVEALGCTSCYCVAIVCNHNPDPSTCTDCYDFF